MKKLLHLFLTGSHLLFSPAYGQRDRRRSYEVIGLPKGNEVSESLIIAIPLIVIGFLICYTTWWNKSAQVKRENASSSDMSSKDYVGCFGFLVIAAGGFFLLPLLSWVEYLFVNALSIGIGIVVIGVILYIIYSWLTKK